MWIFKSIHKTLNFYVTLRMDVMSLMSGLKSAHCHFIRKCMWDYENGIVEMLASILGAVRYGLKLQYSGVLSKISKLHEQLIQQKYGHAASKVVFVVVVFFIRNIHGACKLRVHGMSMYYFCKTSHTFQLKGNCTTSQNWAWFVLLCTISKLSTLRNIWLE